MRTKSGIMVGLGESMDELLATLSDLRGSGCDVATVGQYLQPYEKRLPVERYYTPAEFDEIRAAGEAMGFSRVEAGPLVRSSYHARRALDSSVRPRQARRRRAPKPEHTRPHEEDEGILRRRGGSRRGRPRRGTARGRAPRLRASRRRARRPDARRGPDGAEEARISRGPREGPAAGKRSDPRPRGPRGPRRGPPRDHRLAQGLREARPRRGRRVALQARRCATACPSRCS